MSKEIHIVSPVKMYDIILHPKQNEPVPYLCLDDIHNGEGPALIAIDNTTYEAWTEEFDSVKQAVAWLKREIEKEDDQ